MFLDFSLIVCGIASRGLSSASSLRSELWSESCGPPHTLSLDRIEPPPISIEHGRLPRERLPAPDRRVAVPRIDLHQSCLPTAALTPNQSGARAAEKIRDDIAGLAAVEKCALDQFHRLGCRMDSVGRGLFLVPQSRLGLVPVPGILPPGHMGIEDRLVLELVTPKTPSKRVFGPNDLAADPEPRGFDGVLKLPLPLRG